MIIAAYILLITPILDVINSVLNLDFNIRHKKGEEFIIEETKRNKGSYVFEVILLIFSLLLFVLITWYTFTNKIPIAE